MKEKGFTLIEIMVVIIILSILSAISIPMLLRARLQTNEALSLSTIIALRNACEMFFDSYKRYPLTLQELTQTRPPFISYTTHEEDGQFYIHKSGYRFLLYNKGDDAYSYIIEAQPLSYGYSGKKFYRIDETGIIEYKNSAGELYQPYRG